MTLLWVTLMCVLMSLYATLVNVGTEHDFWRHYLIALVSQAFIVGPLVRNLDIRIFRPAGYVASV